MTVETIRDAIVATINSVDDVGNVHRLQPNIRDAKKLKEKFGIEGNRILGWTVSRLSARESATTHTYNTVWHRWEIRGYMGVVEADETEVAFDLLIEAVRDAFRNNDDLGGAVDTITTDQDAGLQLVDQGYGYFSNTLVHTARLILETEGDHEPDALALVPFETADTRWDLGPLPDGAIEANDQVELEQ